jgi:mono/diheme cytochrome c family protein
MRDPATDTQQPIVVGREGIAYTDLAVLAPHPAPAVLLDAVPGVDVDPDLAAASAGAVHIRSVYDFAGNAAQDIEALRDPLRTPADQRPARFLRLVKAVSMPDRDVVELPGTAFGRSQAQLMREILGYGMIEPDGSVLLQVPANVAFWPEVLDADGRRIGDRHQNWLQVAPGEVLQCSGCHTPASRDPHGRPDAEPPSANPGAPTTGSPFPNTDPALFADAGETMAEVRARIRGIPPPDMDVAFVDLWTDPTLRDPDPGFAYRYAALATPAPVDPGCSVQWTANCRITIHYEQHIHPLWAVDRRVFDVDGVTVTEDRTCVRCHGPADDMGLARVPDGQLDLTDGPAPEEPAHLRSYRELLYPDNAQTVQDGALVDELVQAEDAAGNPLFEVDADGELLLDPDGNPIPVMVTVGVAPTLSVAGARQSARFFDRFGAGGSHAGYLSDAELRLLSEWVDIGAQYYNDPFTVPQ